MEKEQVDLYELSEDVVKRLTHIASKRNITLNVIGDAACVHGTKKILDEMIYNICENAIKYNQDNGSVFVSARLEHEDVILKVYPITLLTLQTVECLEFLCASVSAVCSVAKIALQLSFLCNHSHTHLQKLVARPNAHSSIFIIV